MEAHFSQSEENGIKAVPNNAISIYSVGISTAGEAEIRMAKAEPKRKIIATTVDTEGAGFADRKVEDQGFSDQITVKIEDVSGKLPYPDDYFDFVYARLVLHYLPKSGLESALANLYRILKPGGKIYIVVRSTKAENFSEVTSTHDASTGFTTYVSKSNPSVMKRRFFHTPESIAEYVTSAGFEIDYITEYIEEIFTDFKREGRSSNEPLMELVAIK
jgi:ubiquinone/menaquinone biosynthesis C-methylase UbiE